MKGLLLKDFYMTVKYCKAYMLITVVFLALSLYSDENLFFIFYPCLLAGMIPVNLLAYDEHSKWNHYSGTLPYSKAQIISGKYLIGLFAQLAVLILTGIVRAVIMHRDGGFVLFDFLEMMMILLIMSFVTTSLSLPIIFKWGVEKGRIARMVVIGMVCAGTTIATLSFQQGKPMDISIGGLIPVLFIVSIGIYALSWYLSIVFYRKREA